MADTVVTAEGAKRCDLDLCSAPIAGAPAQPALLEELETAPRRTVILETATLLTLAVAFLSLSLFAWIAETFSNPRVQALDVSIRISVHEHASNLMTEAMIAFSRLGEPGVAIGGTLTIGIFLWLRRHRAALWIVVSLICAALLNVSLKFAFHRPRPPAFFGPQPDDFSFPSGHALVSACFYGTVAGLIADHIRSVYWRVLIWVLSLAMIAGVGLSRIYLGVHYPSDVIAGYLAAVAWVCILIGLDRLWMRRAD